MIANTKTNKNKNSKIFNLVNNIYLSFKLNSKRYALLFAALLTVYAQADVSVSDDPKPQESTELPPSPLPPTALRVPTTATPFPARTPRSGCP